MVELPNKNPWVTIWAAPRPTIRRIVDTDPKRSFYWLATLYSLQSILFIANYLSLGLSHHYAVILILSIVLSPVMGTIWIYIYGWLFDMTGKWLGGHAPHAHVRAAFAWSKVPLLINLAMWFILLIFSAEDIFVHYPQGPSLIFINLIMIISGIWSFIILLQCIREVQGFTLGRAIGNVLLGYLLAFVLFLILTLGISFLFSIATR